MIFVGVVYNTFCSIINKWGFVHIDIYLQEFQRELDVKAWDYDIVKTSCEYQLCSSKDLDEYEYELEIQCNELFFKWNDLSRRSFELECLISTQMQVKKHSIIYIS